MGRRVFGGGCTGAGRTKHLSGGGTFGCAGLSTCTRVGHGGIRFDGMPAFVTGFTTIAFDAGREVGGGPVGEAAGGKEGVANGCAT